MKRLLVTTAALAALIAPAHANFAVYGIMNKLMNGIETPSCSQYANWMKTATRNEREVLKEWLLGFRSGLESQMASEPEFNDKATGSEMPSEGFFALINGFCKEFPRTQLLAAVQLNIEYGLKESAKHPNPRYNPGFNIHGLLAKYSCQDLMAEVEGVAQWKSRIVMKRSFSPKRKFIFEEWMLGVATGIEAHALHGKPMSAVTQVDPDEFVKSIYATCRANPTEYVFTVVHDRELANIEAASSNASAAPAIDQNSTVADQPRLRNKGDSLK